MKSIRSKSVLRALTDGNRAKRSRQRRLSAGAAGSSQIEARTGFKAGLGAGAALGACAMYFLDPARGARRRSLLRDGLIHARRKAENFGDAAVKDIRNRSIGLAARTRSRLEPREVGDEILVEHIRSKMGRVVSHPRSVEVTVQNGEVTLSGPILRREVGRLMRVARSEPGVRSVTNKLYVHETSGRIPGLQHSGDTPDVRPGIMQQNWAPATRLAAAIAGGVLLAYSARRGGIIGWSARSAALGLLARGITNRDIRRLTGLGGGREAVTIEKTIHIRAPIEEVFSYWANCENFPYFMRNVREVTDLGDGRTHWIVSGPAGASVEWDAETTRRVDNQVLAWKSLPGSAVRNAGIIQFTPNADGSTRVQIRLSYNPPAGAIGHAAAWLLGADPKKEMDEDLARLKTFIEEGHAPHDAARPSFERIRSIEL